MKRYNTHDAMKLVQLPSIRPRYRTDNLPKLKSNCFLFNGNVGYTGSRIKRWVKGSMGIYKHHGFIYGFDEEDTLWIIELNQNGVECVAFQDFVLGYPFTIEHNTNLFLIDGIMQRAKERSGIPYHVRENNCETFVNYCLGLGLGSNQAKNTEMITNSLFSMCEIYLAANKDSQIFLDNCTKLRAHFKLDRPDSVQQIIDKYKSTDVTLSIKK